ncbi:MAG: glutamine synthetase type III, partial [Coriobacteriaceae bacterium]|nr:glutamine synthetase type III [Coriobacteriaceae bacterium]
LNELEIRSRYEVKLEKYNKLLNIECRVMKRMTRRAFLPAINTYAGKLAKSINAIKEALPDAELAQETTLLNNLVKGVQSADEALQKLDTLHREIAGIVDQQEKANRYAHEALPAMEELRAAIDALEIITDRSHWPVPTYNNLLFYS